MEEGDTQRIKSSFKELGLCDELVDACSNLGWKVPTKIQVEAIPQALEGKDIIGLAQTGSGKTGAFALPVLQALLKSHQPFFCCVITPTRELAFQITEQFEALGSGIGLNAISLVGGVEMNTQIIALGKRPHIIVGTPGRIVDHLTHTKGFSLRMLNYLVLDEADRLLNEDFQQSIDEILQAIPSKRKTFLFSATMTKKVRKLQRACLRNPVKIESASKYFTVDTLKQEYLFIPSKYKDCYFVYVLTVMSGCTTMVFARTCEATNLLASMLRNLGFRAVPINGLMTQDYVHRVGRTARAGRTGVAISLVNQYELDWYLQIENIIGKKLTQYQAKEEEVILLRERVSEAKRLSQMKMKDSGWKRKDKDEDDGEDVEQYLGNKLWKRREW